MALPTTYNENILSVVLEEKIIDFHSQKFSYKKIKFNLGEFIFF